MTNNGEAPPLVEPRPDERPPDVTLRALEGRIRQQQILAELGVMALQGASFDQLLTETANLTARGLGADYCKILEYVPSENCFLVRAGVGWKNSPKSNRKKIWRRCFRLPQGKPILPQSVGCLLQVCRLHQQVVRVERRNGEHADPCFGQRLHE